MKKIDHTKRVIWMARLSALVYLLLAILSIKIHLDIVSAVGCLVVGFYLVVISIILRR